MVSSVVGLDVHGDEIMEALVEHERLMVYSRFDHTVAWELGNRIRRRFIDEKVPLGLRGNIQIRAAGNTANGEALVYFAAVVGTIPPGNATMVAGKANVVTFSGNSSFHTRLSMIKRGVDLKEFGLESPKYFMHGGGFPIRVTGSSLPVAIAVVSGMPSMADDHQIIVDSINDHLGAIRSTEEKA